MSSIKVTNINNASAASGGIAFDADGHVTVDGLQLPSAGALSNRNKIINGDMRIDQRNAGASVTPTTDSQYTLDRHQARLTQASKYSVQRSTTAPAGFTNSLVVTSLSAYSVTSSDRFAIAQLIEGYNVADLGWGTAGAKTVTLSFWVRSSLTGTFGGSIADTVGSQFYVFSYSISSANTWEYKTITIPGTTAGTWNTDNAIGLNVRFGLGAGTTTSGTAGSWGTTNHWQPTGSVSIVGTNGATFYITGVQLEVGSTATPFEHRSFGDELARCQRYYQKSFPVGTAPAQNIGGFGALYTQAHAANSPASGQIIFPVQMRDTPSVFTTYNTSAANGNWRNLTASSDINVALQSTSATGAFISSNTQVMAQYAVAAVQWSATSEL